MFKKTLKTLLLAAVLSIFLACNAQGEVINSTWVGGSGEWRNASNWSPAIVPDNGGGNTFVVTLNAGCDVRIGLQQSRTIDQLDCYGELELQNWTSSADWVQLTLVDPNSLTNHGYLVIGGGLHSTLVIGGNVTNTAGAMLELENMDSKADLYNQAGATVEVFYEVTFDGVVENAGSMVITSAGWFSTDNNFNNLGEILMYGGTCGVREEILDNNDTGLIKGFGVIYVEQLLRNKGQIYAYGGSLAIKCEGPLTNTGTLANKALSILNIQPAEDVNNQGTIEVNAGGGVAFDCNLVNEPNGVINLLGGTLAAATITQKAGATFEGFGGITGNIVIEPNSPSEPNSIVRLTGPTNILGDVSISEGATLEVSDGTTLVTGHTTCNGTIHLKGGRIIPQGGLSGDCSIIWEPGLYTNIADFNLDGKVNLKDYALFADTWLWQTAWR